MVTDELTEEDFVRADLLALSQFGLDDSGGNRALRRRLRRSNPHLQLLPSPNLCRNYPPNARPLSVRRFTGPVRLIADGLTGSRKIQAAHFSNERFSIVSRGCDC